MNNHGGYTGNTLSRIEQQCNCVLIEELLSNVQRLFVILQGPILQDGRVSLDVCPLLHRRWSYTLARFSKPGELRVR